MRTIAIAVIAATLSAACHRALSPTGPTAPSSGLPLSEQRESAAYVFRFSAGDDVDRVWQQAYHEWAIVALQVNVPQRLTYNKYVSRTHMGDITGRYTSNGFAEPDRFEIHTLWRRDNHEVVHVYTALFGSPVALFNEGIAVAYQTDPVAGDFVARWNMIPVHDHARQFRQQGRLMAIANLTATNDFRRFDPDVTYPESGSFVRYLIDTYGLDRMKRLFQRGTPADPADTVRQQFAAVYGRALADAERDWWAFLDNR